jgi:hypothetical protein
MHKDSNFRLQEAVNTFAMTASMSKSGGHKVPLAWLMYQVWILVTKDIFKFYTQLIRNKKSCSEQIKAFIINAKFHTQEPEIPP